jgi:3,4-dihydroxy 2-butanone 4-phosphate synthase / GTP cyclohydrolase II
MPSHIERVKAAIHAIKNGQMVVLSDDPSRENEGDLIIPAEMVTDESMNFMIRKGSGIVCLALTSERAQQLNFPLMLSSQENTCARGTQFTVSVDARDHITTGVSAADRVVTIKRIVDDKATPDDFVKPGHLFPLIAKTGGVLERQGHTEGSIDLARLAGFKNAAVLCEIMNPDGSMARGKQLEDFAAEHQLTLLSINDIIAYRLAHETNLAEESQARLPLDDYGNFTITVIKDKLTNQETVVLIKEGTEYHQPVLVRIHSSCMTGDIFASKRCDCHQQLHYSLDRISKEGGVLIYMNQEGRGIGLFNKIKAYALQENGMDTVDANAVLGLPVDSRNYHVAAAILRKLGIEHIRLLTNNPHKISDMQQHGIHHVEREAMPSFDNQHNRFYLETKNTKLNHRITLT